jgi:hypothetical protein
MMPVLAYWYVLCCKSCLYAFPFPRCGFDIQILSSCFYFTVISWNTGFLCALMTQLFQVMKLVVVGGG